MQKLVGLPQILNQLVYSLLLHLVVVESYAKVGGKVELTCQVTKHTLEESIYCFNAKVVVVVNEQTECSTGILFYLLLRGAKLSLSVPDNPAIPRVHGQYHIAG